MDQELLSNTRPCAFMYELWEWGDEGEYLKIDALITITATIDSGLTAWPTQCLVLYTHYSQFFSSPAR